MAEAHDELRRLLGPVGAWSFALQSRSAASERVAAAEIEAMGWPSLWVPEGLRSKEIFAHASLLLSATERMTVASGIANIWARDPVAMANGHRVLADAFPDRFVLGIGVSHAPSVERRTGIDYDRPYSKMIAYLDAMDDPPTDAPQPAGPMRRILAALGPRMLRLASERALGAHSYFVPPEHTEQARAVLGPEPVLAVEQVCVLEADAVRARAAGRAYASYYLGLPNYANNLGRLGWDDEDLAGEGSDRLVDAVVAWGDVDRVRARVRTHLDAGADHVAVQVIGLEAGDLCLPQLRELAGALLGP